MIFRDTRTSMVHPTQKYGCTEMQLWNQIKRLPPVYEGRVSKGKISFDAGDVRSTVDDVLLEKSSNAAERAANLRRELLEKLESVRGTRGTLQNSLLHHFLSCGIDKEEIGELTLDHPEVEKAASGERPDHLWSCLYLQHWPWLSHCEPRKLRSWSQKHSPKGLRRDSRRARRLGSWAHGEILGTIQKPPHPPQ